MKTGGFLNPEAIRILINANIDKNAPHFTFMSTHGTIFGHDKDQDIKAVRKFGAFAGTTWLRHEKAIAETGQASPEPDFGLSGQTLKVTVDKDGKSMRSMVVNIDGMVSAICFVKDRTVLAAQIEKLRLVGETDELALMVLDKDDVDNVDEVAQNGVIDTEAVSTHSEDRKMSVGTESEDGKGKEVLNSSVSNSTLSSENNVAKIRILEIRAETMAKAFAEEICGPDFRMPLEFK